MELDVNNSINFYKQVAFMSVYRENTFGRGEPTCSPSFSYTGAIRPLIMIVFREN